MAERDDFDELHRLGDELRQQVGGEFRRTAEEDEYAAAKAQLRSRRLEHVAFELLGRGDTVAITIGDDRYGGTVSHARGDLLTLETLQGARIDVRLGSLIAIQVVQRATTGGRSRDRFGPDSFVARLRELELDEIEVVLIVPAAGGTVVGRIDAVTPDHVMVTGDARWFLPLDGVAAVTMR